MPERALHEDLGAYVLGMLDPGELETFRAHLAGCAECQRELEELEGTARLLARAPKAVEPRADLRVRTLAALQQAQAEAEHERIDAQPRRAGRRPWLSWGIGGAVAVAAATAALILGIQLGGDDGPAGELELRATLASVSGDATALAEVVKLGIGREIDFRTDELPILPKGEFYELWFAAPEDSPSAPKRISAGTFHPDENGRTEVTMTVAVVDPALYPTLVVSAEPGDGDPAASGNDVLRSTPAGSS